MGRRVEAGEVKGSLLLRSFPDLCLVISPLLSLGVQRKKMAIKWSFVLNGAL